MQCDFSVLMTTYHGERAENLDASLRSLFVQNLRPKEIVVVLDGPVGGDQESVLARWGAMRDGIPLHVERLPRNGGLARALNAGLPLCSGEFVVRMDSDDMARRTRIEELYCASRRHPEAGLFFSWHAEFDDATQRTTGVKVTPPDHDETLKRLKWRNVISHPTVMIRRTSLLEAGGYRWAFGLLEDYDLFVRLAVAGVRFQPINKVLLDFRVSAAQRSRRGGLAYALREMHFRWHCHRIGFLTLGECVGSTSAYVVFRLMPWQIKDWLYRFVRSGPARDRSRCRPRFQQLAE